MVKVG